MPPFAGQLLLLFLLAAVRSGFPQTIELLGKCISLGGKRCIRAINNCQFPVWPGVRVQQGNNTPEYTGFSLGHSRSFQFPASITNVKIWGRTGCNVQSIPFNCDTGNCGPNVTCTQDAQLPATFVNIFPTTIGSELYDVSLMEGFNVPISVNPFGLTATVKSPLSKCSIAGDCKYNMASMENCPLDLFFKNQNGAIVGCQSPCERYDSDEACCRGQYDTKEKCLKQDPMPALLMAFTDACPKARVSPFDNNVFSCPNLPVIGNEYTINFC